MTNNTYLVQALEGYRLRTEGQFGSVTESVLPLTQDAAEEIKRLNARLEAPERRTIPVTNEPLLEHAIGTVSFLDWRRLAKLVEEDDGTGLMYVRQLSLDEGGIYCQWEYRDA